MFRRREDGTEELITDSEASTSSSTSNTSTAPTAPASLSQAAPAAPIPAAPAAQSFRPVPPQAAVAAAARPAAPSAPATPASAAPSMMENRTPTAPSAAARGGNKRVLTVGPEIQMKGEITSCDRVVIEGVVDATMRDVHTVELAETGTLKGTAEVEDAEISGTFEGDLIVRGKLTLTSSGRVRGNVTYGEIEIQRGGQISGNIRNVAEAKANAAAASAAGKKAA